MRFRIPKPTRRQFHILLGYNLPLLLWILAALAQPFFQTAGWPCPVRSLTGWCPACGLTGNLAALLYGHHAPDLRLTLVLLAFTLNFLWSLRKIIFLPPER